MNIDEAIGKIYIVLNDCRGASGYLEALKAVAVLEHSAEALNKSQQVLNMMLSDSFDKKLHLVLLNEAITRNAKIIDP